MAAKNKLTVSIAPTKSGRQTGAERRDALNAALVTEQADLKRDAEQRRAERAAREVPEHVLPADSLLPRTLSDR